MELNTLLTLGKRIYVIKDQKLYLTNIQDYDDDNVVMIGVPITKGLPLYIPVGTVVELGFWEPHGIYTYDGEVTECVWSNALRMYRVEPRSEVRRIQRRDNFRLAVACRADVQVLDEESGRAVERFIGYTINISATGAAIKSPWELDSGTLLQMTIDIAEFGEFISRAQVVHSRKTEPPDETWAVGVRFMQGMPADQRRLVRFLRSRELMGRRE